MKYCIQTGHIYVREGIMTQAYLTSTQLLSNDLDWTNPWLHEAFFLVSKEQLIIITYELYDISKLLGWMNESYTHIR